MNLKQNLEVWQTQDHAQALMYKQQKQRGQLKHKDIYLHAHLLITPSHKPPHILSAMFTQLSAVCVPQYNHFLDL